MSCTAKAFRILQTTRSIEHTRRYPTMHPRSHHPMSMVSSVSIRAAATLALGSLAACGGAKPTGSDAAAIRGVISGARASGSATSGGSGNAGTGTPQTQQTAESGWVSLFNGKDLAGWHNFKTPGAPVVGWSVVNGDLVRTGEGGDLTTDKQYANFELELEWKVEPGGNSGIIYRIDPSSEVTYTSGPEMQVLDDERHADGKNPLTSAGAGYGLYPAPRGIVKAAGEWNSARLVVNGSHVEHWLNGTRVVEYELGSPDWEARRKASKFANWAGYGRATRGYIALQDHGDRVTYRNIRIRELP